MLYSGLCHLTSDCQSKNSCPAFPAKLAQHEYLITLYLGTSVTRPKRIPSRTASPTTSSCVKKLSFSLLIIRHQACAHNHSSRLPHLHLFAPTFAGIPSFSLASTRSARRETFSSPVWLALTSGLMKWRTTTASQCLSLHLWTGPLAD